MTSPKTLGLVAGNGLFPKLFIEAAHAREIEVVAVAMRGEDILLCTVPLPGIAISSPAWLPLV